VKTDSTRPILRRAFTGSALFAAGYALAAVLPFSTSINTGLVQALDSVGKSLYGSQVFSARALPPNPVFPSGAVALDVATDSRIGTSIGVFIPSDSVQPGPCAQIALFEIVPPTAGLGDGSGSWRLRYDPARLTAEAAALPPNPVNVARCAAP
jgi:hypothetical protein